MPGKDRKIDHVDRSAAESREPEHRMDGGITAWLQVLGSWILFLNSWFVEEALCPDGRQREVQSYQVLGAFLIFLEHLRRIIPPFFYLIVVLQA
jgi:hypothetical protein